MSVARSHTLSIAWHDMSPRRQAAWLAIALLVMIVVAGVATPPLMAAVARAEQDSARDAHLLQVARQRSVDGEALARAASPARTGDVRAAVEAALARYGVPSTPSATSAADGQFGVVIGEVSFDTLVRALDALARTDAVQIVEARITALAQRGRVRADLTFGR